MLSELFVTSCIHLNSIAAINESIFNYPLKFEDIVRSYIENKIRKAMIKILFS